MKKKVVKIAAIIILLLLGVIIAIPFILEKKAGEVIKNKVNSSIDAKFDFAEAKLSLIRSFPNAELTINEVVLLNNAPFEGDTLFKSGQLDLTMSVFELFKDASKPLQLISLNLDKATLYIHIDSLENTNYDILKEKDTAEKNDPATAFTLDLQQYSITNSRVIYDDRESPMLVEVSEINHKGTGDLSLQNSKLQTSSTALVSLTMDGTEYLKNNPVTLEALIGIDLETYTYTFLENTGQINQLPLVFDGYVKVGDDFQEIAINFKTPSSDFRNFLAVFPEAYSKNIKDVTTTGNFMVEGSFDGILDDTYIPKFTIAIQSDNASFKYPNLPKAVENIVIDAKVTNETGLSEDTFVTIQNASFRIDQDRFKMNSKITDLTGNTKVNATIDANINLANISKAYPYAAEKNLKGILKGNITTFFDMVSLEKKQYQNTRTAGQLSISGFEYSSPELLHPVLFQTIALDFKQDKVNLNKMEGKMGKTDFNASGTINNLLGFLFNNEEVEGNFNLNSKTFSVNDFMVQKDKVAAKKEVLSTKDKAITTSSETIKIPSFLNCTINAKAGTVLYDNLVLKDVQGLLRIKDETATITNLTSSLFDGKLAVNGEVSTKQETSTFAMTLGIQQFQIAEAFASLELFKALAPVASALMGQLNSDIVISGNLGNDFTPDLATISGNVLAQVLGTKINPEKANVLNAVSNQLKFIELDKFNVSGLKTALSFQNGIVTVKPFTVAYQDIAITVNGSHSFDKKLNYKATLQVPVKYLGPEVNNLIAKIDDASLKNLTIPVTANIEGMYATPQVRTDFSSGVKDLTTQLVAIQKQKMLSQGKEKASGLIEGLLKGKTTTSDTSGTKKPATDAVKETLGNILKPTPKSKDSAVEDSTAAGTKNDAVKEAAKSVLGGLLKKKKKDSTILKKDTIKQ